MIYLKESIMYKDEENLHEDLVQRLRDCVAGYYTTKYYDGFMSEAADEIERLREENNHLRNDKLNG
jgi:formylmethanofuran:tetrahydromethanopterin formyltransferase